jgi:hypothetical protein
MRKGEEIVDPHGKTFTEAISETGLEQGGIKKMREDKNEPVHMKLEVIIIPVSDVDRAKRSMRNSVSA